MCIIIITCPTGYNNSDNNPDLPVELMPFPNPWLLWNASRSGRVFCLLCFCARPRGIWCVDTSTCLLFHLQQVLIKHKWRLRVCPFVPLCSLFTMNSDRLPGDSEQLHMYDNMFTFIFNFLLMCQYCCHVYYWIKKTTVKFCWQKCRNLYKT